MSILVTLWILSFFAMLGGSVEEASIFILGLIILIAMVKHNARVNNYDITKVDVNKMRREVRKSPYEIQKNMINGKYDK